MLARVSEVTGILLAQGVVVIILDLTDRFISGIPVPRSRSNGGDWAFFLQDDDLDSAPEQRPEHEWAAALQDAVRSAVRRQMVADVPVGSFLSGGVDSSAIVAEMSSVRSNVTTYTVGSPASWAAA